MHLSLRESGAREPLLVLTTVGVSEASIRELQARDIRVSAVAGDYGLPPDVATGISVARWQGTFAKLAAFELCHYDKLVFLDADLLINRNIDELFERQHMSAAVYYGRVHPFAHLSFPNSGVMVIAPRKGLGHEIFAQWPAAVRIGGSFSDQTLIHIHYNALFRAADRGWELPVTYNACAFVLDKIVQHHGLNTKYHAPDDQTVAVVHFSSPVKPWLMPTLHLLQLYARKVLRGRWHELRSYQRYFSLLHRVRNSTINV